MVIRSLTLAMLLTVPIGCQHWFPNQKMMEQHHDAKAPHHVPSSPIGKVANLVLEESKGGVFIKSIALADDYALVTVLAQDALGQTLLHNDLVGWKIKYHHGSLMTQEDLRDRQVPAATVAKLLEKQRLRQVEREKELAEFRQAWRVVNPKIAPFLGYWAAGTTDIKVDNIESTLSIWPQKNSDRVCMIGIGNGTQYVTVGEIREGNRLSNSVDVFVLTPAPSENGAETTVLLREPPRQDNDYDATEREPQKFYAAGPLNNWYFSKQALDALHKNNCTKNTPSP